MLIGTQARLPRCSLHSRLSQFCYCIFSCFSFSFQNHKFCFLQNRQIHLLVAQYFIGNFCAVFQVVLGASMLFNPVIIFSSIPLYNISRSDLEVYILLKSFCIGNIRMKRAVILHCTKLKTYSRIYWEILIYCLWMEILYTLTYHNHGHLPKHIFILILQIAFKIN